MYITMTFESLSSTHPLMLLIVWLHPLPDLFYNLCSIIHTLCLKVVSFRVLLISDDDHLCTKISLLLVDTREQKILAYPKGLWMPSTNFASHNHTERHPAGLGTAIEQRLPRFPRQDMHVILVHQQDPWVRCGK